MAKFAANANPFSTTKIPPFQATRGYVPRMRFNPVDLSEELTRVTDRILTNQLTNHPTILRANLAYSTSRTLATH